MTFFKLAIGSAVVVVALSAITVLVAVIRHMRRSSHMRTEIDRGLAEGNEIPIEKSAKVACRFCGLAGKAGESCTGCGAPLE